MSEYLYTPFDGKKLTWPKLSQACRELGLTESTVRNAMQKKKNEKKPVCYIWEGGKLERLEVK